MKFLVDNSLGKCYLEMYPDSDIRSQFAIANAPDQQLREPIPLPELRLIDPACGSGNFLLYAFDFFYALYLDQIENYGANYAKKDIPTLIVAHNLHGIDLDDRAVQLAQLGLYIKARRRNRQLARLDFKVVASAFFLPDYAEVQHIFDTPERPLSDEQQKLVQEIWSDLQQAHRFGSLVRVGEKVTARLETLVARFRKPQLDAFAERDIVDFEIFQENFFRALETAVAAYAQDSGETFLSSKTRDAITYLRLLTTRYQVAVANPPYTDSGDFGPDLKKYINDNYKKPFKFNSNLYATFIKRTLELVTKDGYAAMVHPPTFMYIKSFEDVRKFLVERFRIDLFIDWGYLGMFNQAARVDSCAYVLRSGGDRQATFVRLSDLYEGKRKEIFDQVYLDLVHNNPNDRIYTLPQDKLKIIPSWPFIYWISDGFREKFGEQTVADLGAAKPGLQTGKNERFLRFWWEVSPEDISTELGDGKRWVGYSKGGDYCKWFGNLWLKVDWENEGNKLENYRGSLLRNSNWYLRKGITYSASGSKGTSFRLLPENHVFDVGGASIFLNNDEDIFYTLGVLNSSLSQYVINCLNPTVNTQKGDIDRIPIYTPSNGTTLIAELSKYSITIKQSLQKFSLIEDAYSTGCFNGSESSLSLKLQEFFSFENWLLSQVYLAQAIIDEQVVEVFVLEELDRELIRLKSGPNIGSLPVTEAARSAYLREDDLMVEFSLDHLRTYIDELPVLDISEEEISTIRAGFSSLYQSNNDLEEFCIRHQVNPINVWFRENNVVPAQRARDLTMEFLADMIRELLREDDDGIIPLVPNAGEQVLLDRIEQRFYERGFTSAQFAELDQLLGRPLADYLNGYFFAHLSDHLNLFMYLPKTPFIWHLSSGPAGGFDCYVLIYSWDRDKLYRLRSIYLEQRERALVNLKADLQSNESAAAQNEKAQIDEQLHELEIFRTKIDELLAEGYDPVLDSGVGKNIAPLQAKGMLAYDVLNAGQLKKYLAADW